VIDYTNYEVVSVNGDISAFLGLVILQMDTHGLRRGLHFSAATRL
jgi:hypothetical protein